MKSWPLFASILVLSPIAFGAQKAPQVEIKELQTDLVKNKNSIENLLNNRAHIIPNENYSSPVASVVRQVSLGALRDGANEKVFFGPEAISTLIKSYQIERSPNTGDNAKIYSLTVINPDHLKALEKGRAELKAAINEEDKVSTIISRYIDYSMKAQRFITFKEAENLSNQLAKMNSDLQDLQELAVKLSLKEQGALALFQKNMDEWLNKKLVFVSVGREGFKIDVNNDHVVYLPGVNAVRSAYLNRDYSPSNVALVVKKTLGDSIIERQRNSSWDDFQIVQAKNKEDVSLFSGAYNKYKISVKDVDSIKVDVSADLKVAHITTNKVDFRIYLGYQKTSSYIISINDKLLYDHAQSYEANYYNTTYDVNALLKLTGIAEIAMKGVYRNHGQDYFSNSKKGEISVK